MKADGAEIAWLTLEAIPGLGPESASRLLEVFASPDAILGASAGQLSPLVGLLGSVLGFIKIFAALESAGAHAHLEQLSAGVWQAMISTAAGLAVAIPCYAAYNYLVNRVNNIVLDMERAATEILNIVSESSPSA